MKKVYVGKFYGPDLMLDGDIIATREMKKETGLPYIRFRWGKDERGEFLKIWLCDEENTEVRDDKIRLS